MCLIGFRGMHIAPRVAHESTCLAVRSSGWLAFCSSVASMALESMIPIGVPKPDVAKGVARHLAATSSAQKRIVLHLSKTHKLNRRVEG